MQLIKLDATASTNLYLKELLVNGFTADYTVVWAKNQTKGRGQMGNQWLVEPGKNLTFSVLRSGLALAPEDFFYLNAIVSLSIVDVLKSMTIVPVTVKWPNDIMAGNKKICGILTENQFKGPVIDKSIMGIGLNVNQTNFGEMSNVTSLKTLVGTDFNLEIILGELIKAVKRRFLEYPKENYLALLKVYEQQLFRINKVSAFEDGEGKISNAMILGVARSGKLKLLKEDESEIQIAFKELRLLY
ncbi:biotin--[acetyl-CoA-carboxylase] ligase [Croceivirga radicis]|uniref:Biotin--[acetyl-CoA-carboxylase] ligase n=1 Tax=Croceivirga radicis TaxID=1929488 RepID=A0A1V6LN57_9FLAO|nr:biotin--[acetyl-CoA-carboxylase] ligase [Croceivirga radicis]OQD41634.1 biotin--[acetyl-CoA-carboxylase] ligase [Croceivirga radicis]